MTSKICPICGVAFDLKYNHQIFCTPECFHKARIHIIRCPGCGIEFETERSDRKYCSLECQYKHRKYPRQRTYYTYTCEWCNKKFKSHKHNRRFCSNECASASLSLERVGENNPMYKGVRSYRRGRNWQTQRKRAIERDGYTCQICGKKPRNGQKRVVSVHHIKPYRYFNGDWKQANDLSNLITLCTKCHAAVDWHNLPCPQPLL